MIVTDVAVRNFFFSIALACKISLIFASFEHCTKISVLVLLIFVKSKRGFSSLPSFTFLPGCGNKEPSNFKSDHQISPSWKNHFDLASSTLAREQARLLGVS